MKRFKRHLIQTVLTLFMLTAYAGTTFGDTPKAQADSIEVSLLTCGPRPNIYSLYGHTAIRYNDKNHGIDLAVNYGMFSFGKPFFILRFVFGLTDYEMGIEYFSDFVRHYQNSGCGIRQQVLNLTHEEKESLANAINENFLPANRVYRYNYFYDNCTTRARDIIARSINGTIKYRGDDGRKYPSFRTLIHSYNETHRWARFGNDLLLGVKADRPTDFKQHQFLPEMLSNDFGNATIVDNNGGKRPLVTKDYWVLPCTHGVGNDSFPLSPMTCMYIFSLTIIAIMVIECISKKIYWITDIVIMSVAGICGLILFAMVFSQHPTVSFNLQILMLNPVALAMTIPIVKSIKKKKCSLWIYIWSILLVLFIAGRLIQSYAEGLIFVALSLLIRNIHTIISLRKSAIKTTYKLTIVR